MKYSLGQDIAKHAKWILGGFVIAIAVFGYTAYEYYLLKEEFNSTVIAFTQKVDDLEKSLDGEVSRNDELSGKLTAEQQKISGFQTQLGEFVGTVKVLDKLSKTDPELLQKYSKVFFLNEHYVPEKLSLIEPNYLYNEEKPAQIYTPIKKYLTDMLNASIRDGEEIFVFSAYRSFGTQSSLKSGYKLTYGAGTANQFSADQGYSEHQLGTTVDLITTGIGGTLSGFEKTDAYVWLTKNAHKYGFTLSYPEDNQYYVFEPWHWRFVGVELATKLHNDGNYFYDLNQRDIDKYLVSFLD